MASSRPNGKSEDDEEVEVEIAIPPTDSLEEFLLYPRAALVLGQYLLASNQAKEDDSVMFLMSCRDFKDKAPALAPEKRRESATRIFAGFLKVCHLYATRPLGPLLCHARVCLTQSPWARVGGRATRCTG
jgi:hypothetical protein